jgi:hypothetical protein
MLGFFTGNKSTSKSTFVKTATRFIEPSATGPAKSSTGSSGFVETTRVAATWF